MSVRLNITVPDGLHERLQVIKEGVNISAICQAALERAVNLEEARGKAKTKRDEAIVRLRQEAENAADEWFNFGKQEGLDAAANTGYSDFIALKDYLVSGSPENIPAKLETFEWMKDSAVDAECPSASLDKFFAGVVDGLMEFWNDVESEVMS